MFAKLVRWYDLAMSRCFDKLRGPLLLVLRLIFGWGLFQTGKGKLENIDRFTDFLTHLHIPMPAVNAQPAVLINQPSMRPRINDVSTSASAWYIW